MSSIRLAALLAIVALWVPDARVVAQTLPSGVINAPPTVIGDFESIGSNTTLNVLPGGLVGDNFQAGNPWEPSEGIVVDISGGSVGRDFVAFPGSTVRVRGGVIGSGVNAFGDDFELVGGDFRVNGSDYDGSRIALVDGDVFTGTLQDGSPLIFSRSAFDYVSGVRLTAVELPPIDLTPQVIDGAGAGVPPGLRSGQALTLRDGGVLGDSFAAIDATVVIEGGVVGEGAEFAGSVATIAGGSVGDWARAHRGSVVDITGGAIGDAFHAHAGSVATIIGGTFGRRFQADAGSVVRISGGSFGDDFRAYSDVELVGDEFRLNGVSIDPQRFQFLAGNTLSGTFADGSPFIFTAAADYFSNVVLTGASVPAADTTPLVVGVGATATIPGLRVGQSMSVQSGGTVADNFQVVGGSMLVEGGDIGDALEVIDGSVVVQGGSVGSGTEIYSGGVLAVSAGHVGSSLDLRQGSTFQISGGSIGSGIRALDATVDIRGGSVGSYFDIYDDSVVAIRGGSFGRVFRSREEATVELIGNDFRANGVPIETSDYSLPSLTVLTGTLEDGSPFVFSREVGDRLESVTLTRVPLTPADGVEIIVDADSESLPNGIRAGQSLVVLPGGSLGDDFAAVDATLRLAGGVLGREAEFVRSSIEMTSGAIGDGFRAFAGSTLDVRGGAIGDRFHMEDDTTISLFGRQFTIDGVPIDGLSFGQAIEVTDRNATLTGILADGSGFDIDLYWVPFASRDYVSQNATVSVTLVPDPGDYNGDGFVDAVDYDAWTASYGETVAPYSGADGNGDGVVDAADYSVWRDNLPTASLSVPEPAATLLLAAGVLISLTTRRRSLR